MAMMTPEDVLLESIAAASIYGDSASLRAEQCRKLKVAMRLCAGIPVSSDAEACGKGDRAR